MLSIGWSEMLIVAAVALIVVGPRDLPAMLRNVGRFVGTIRRMGNEFRTELNKVAAVDEVRDIRKSLTDPIRHATDDIRSEFNKITPAGVAPSGKLSPDKGESESVVKQIQAQAGMSDEASRTATKDSIQKAVKKAARASADNAAAEKAAVPAAKAKAPGKSKAGSRSGSKTAAARPKAATKAAAKPKTATKAKTAKPAARPKATAAKAKARPARSAKA